MPPSLSLEDRNIAARLRDGDPAAFDAIIREHGPGMCRFILSQIRSPELAEELVQDIFLNIWERRAEFNPRTSLKSYLFTSARNKAIDHIRHERVKQEYREETGHRGEPLSTTPDEILAGEELEEAIRRVVQELPDRCRLIFSLQREEGMSYAEIARVLGISQKTVETQMGRALKTLRKRLAPFLLLLSALLPAGNPQQVVMRLDNMPSPASDEIPAPARTHGGLANDRICYMIVRSGGDA